MRSGSVCKATHVVIAAALSHSHAHKVVFGSNHHWKEEDGTCRNSLSMQYVFR